MRHVPAGIGICGPTMCSQASTRSFRAGRFEHWGMWQTRDPPYTGRHEPRRLDQRTEGTTRPLLLAKVWIECPTKDHQLQVSITQQQCAEETCSRMTSFDSANRSPGSFRIQHATPQSACRSSRAVIPRGVSGIVKRPPGSMYTRGPDRYATHTGRGSAPLLRWRVEPATRRIQARILNYPLKPLSSEQKAPQILFL